MIDESCRCYSSIGLSINFDRRLLPIYTLDLLGYSCVPRSRGEGLSYLPITSLFLARMFSYDDEWAEIDFCCAAGDPLFLSARLYPGHPKRFVRRIEITIGVKSRSSLGNLMLRVPSKSPKVA